MTNCINGMVNIFLLWIWVQYEIHLCQWINGGITLKYRDKKQCCFHDNTFLVDYAPLFSFRLSAVESAGSALSIDRRPAATVWTASAGGWLSSHPNLYLFINNFESCLPLPVVMVHPLLLRNYFFLWPFHISQLPTE